MGVVSWAVVVLCCCVFWACGAVLVCGLDCASVGMVETMLMGSKWTCLFRVGVESEAEATDLAAHLWGSFEIRDRSMLNQPVL
jgi:hypothetical protein